MRPAQARFVIGCRMRELREAAGVPLSRAAAESGWDKGHLSRVERGHTKPSRELIEWYDASFGAGQSLVNQLMELDAAVRAGRDMSQRDMRRHVQPVLLGGSVPIDHHPDDRAELVGETVPDGTRVCRDQPFEKTWEIRNSGEKDVEAMRKRGLNVVSVDAKAREAWRKTAESMYPRIRGAIVPADAFDEALRYRDEYRKRAGAPR